jgi:hypothetical protein
MDRCNATNQHSNHELLRCIGGSFQSIDSTLTTNCSVEAMNIDLDSTLIHVKVIHNDIAAMTMKDANQQIKESIAKDGARPATITVQWSVIPQLDGELEVNMQRPIFDLHSSGRKSSRVVELGSALSRVRS